MTIKRREESEQVDKKIIGRKKIARETDLQRKKPR